MGSGFKEELEVTLGFQVPVDINQKRLWFLTLAQFVGFIVVWLNNYAILGHGWALYENQPVLWVLQLMVIFQAWHITGYNDANPQEGRRLLPIQVVCILNWLLAFVWIITETVQCERIDSEDSAIMQQCYDMVSTTLTAESGVMCQADVDIATKATGVCPRVRFGNGGGVAWMVWQYVLVIFFLASNVVGLYNAAKLEVKDEERDTEIKRGEAALFRKVESIPMASKPPATQPPMGSRTTTSLNGLRFGP